MSMDVNLDCIVTNMFMFTSIQEQHRYIVKTFETESTCDYCKKIVPKFVVIMTVVNIWRQVLKGHVFGTFEDPSKYCHDCALVRLDGINGFDNKQFKEWTRSFTDKNNL